VYWLARMVEGGEDPKFIARRMLILAAEDIGIANPNALLIAQACFEAINVIGWPESRIILSEAAIYLATSPKSNSSIMAIDNAIGLVKSGGDLPVPLHIRNAPTSLMKNLGYGKDYKYAHSYEGNFIRDNFLPEEIKGTVFYEPGINPKEEEVRKRLSAMWKDFYDYDKK
jgi:putative ATPase